MPYPLEFRPNQLADLYDGAGGVVNTSVPLQLFRPLLALQFNTLPNDFREFARSGGQIHRFACEDATWGLLPFGPGSWEQNSLPSYVLAEDPLVRHWYVTDATIWKGPGGDPLVAGFAVKKHSFAPDETAVVLAPGAPLPALNNPYVHLGTYYDLTLPPGGDVWYQVAMPGLVTSYLRTYEATAGGGPMKWIFWAGRPPVLVNRADTALNEWAQIINSASVGDTMWLEVLNLDGANPCRRKWCLTAASLQQGRLS